MPPAVTSPAATAVDPETSAALPAQLEIGCRFEFDVPAPVHAVVIVEPHRERGGTCGVGDLHGTR